MGVPTVITIVRGSLTMSCVTDSPVSPNAHSHAPAPAAPATATATVTATAAATAARPRWPAGRRRGPAPVDPPRGAIALALAFALAPARESDAPLFTAFISPSKTHHYYVGRETGDHWHRCPFFRRGR